MAILRCHVNRLPAGPMRDSELLFADIEAIVRQKICGPATDEMSDLYSTVPQREIQAAVGAVSSLAKYRELLPAARWW